MQKKIKRFVIDNSVLVSYIISGKLEKLIKYCFQNNLEFYACPCLFKELIATLNKPSVKKFIDFPVSDYVEIIKDIYISKNIEHIYTTSPDPFDNFLFDICICNNAHLVTKDKLLLNHPFNKKIFTVNSFFDLY